MVIGITIGFVICFERFDWFVYCGVVMFVVLMVVAVDLVWFFDELLVDCY